MKTRNEQATCETCPHYDADCGVCRRFPKTVSQDWLGHPGVLKSDWCGEHPDFFIEVKQ